jgi:hypothetical protein
MICSSSNNAETNRQAIGPGEPFQGLVADTTGDERMADQPDSVTIRIRQR